jgi:hypothetical protein
MIGQNPKKSNVEQTKFFISYDVMLEYICAKNMYVTQHTKKCKYIQKMIKLIFNFYKICNIY